MRKLPEGMIARAISMGVFILGLAMGSLGNIADMVYVTFVGSLAVGAALLAYIAWGPRTRPIPNAFWILLAILWSGLAILPMRPVLAIMAVIPVALLWLHDAPSTPGAMMGYGLVMLMYPARLQIWEDAGTDQAFWVGLSMLLICGAAMWERERLARGIYAPVTAGWLWLRASFLMVFTMAFIGLRETFVAPNLFARVGFDMRGLGGQLAMIALIITALSFALFLFRMRPVKAPKLSPPKPAQAVAAAPETKRVAPSEKMDFGSEAGKRSGKQRLPTQAPAKKPRARPAPRAKPGELEFD